MSRLILKITKRKQESGVKIFLKRIEVIKSLHNNHANTTRDEDRQQYFEDALNIKDAELKEAKKQDEQEKGDNEKCP